MNASLLRQAASGLAPGGAIGGTSLAERQALEVDWRAWLTALFPAYVQHGFAERHVAFWDWLWAIRPDARPHPFVAIWPRGGAKSTSAELGCVALGARDVRSYVLYICETQEQADDHVQNIAAMLESSRLERLYPDLASRRLGKYGNVKGWRRNRLRTAAGLTIDAIGLDTAARGIKLEEQRPDFLVIDDVDGELDSPGVTEKKIAALTKKLLPAGANDVAVLAIQNLVHPDSIFARFVDGRADFLADRMVSGPHPAVVDLVTEQRGGRFVIAGGEATWQGQDLARCQQMIDDFGLTAFLSECQQAVEAPAGGMFDHLDFDAIRCRWEDVPDLTRIVVWCDPAVTDTDRSDAHGIQADGIAANGVIYRLWSWEQRSNPEDVLKRAILKAVELKAECVGVETDQGGDTWRSVYDKVWRDLLDDPTVPQIHGEIPAVGDQPGIPATWKPAFRADKASAGHGPKAHRAQQMLVDYEHGRFRHVIGTHATLERALRRFPRTKPFDLTDASFWSWHDLATVSLPYQGAGWEIFDDPPDCEDEDEDDW